MGARAQVEVRDGAAGAGMSVYLYTHWGSGDLPETVARALQRGMERWDDGEYLARIILCEMVEGEEMSTTGFGIGTAAHSDLDYPPIVVDVVKQEVTVEAPVEYLEGASREMVGWFSFEAFVAQAVDQWAARRG